MKIFPRLLLSVLLCNFFISCSEEQAKEAAPSLIIKLDVDPEQIRLGNAGNPETMPEGHAGQDPVFHKISSHYVEFAPDKWTALGQGAVLYHAPEKTIDGATAIDFNQAIVTAPGETFLEIPLKDLPAGSYEWVRLSLSYQNYDIDFNFQGQPYTGTVASFVGFNTYIEDFTVKQQTVEVNDARKQGYWAFEHPYGVIDGQAPEGATTVPNPIADSSPIPAGSCVVTGEFGTPLVITGKETKDVVITMSLSVNKSFEWIDSNGNGKWDVDQEEQVVDMGLRGLIPVVE